MNLETQIIDILTDSLKKEKKAADEIKSAENWKELGFDSLETVELIMKIEDAFEIEIDDLEAEGIKNYNLLLEFLKGKIK